MLHPLLPTHIYTTAHVPGFWYFILYSQHTYTRQHTFLVSGTSPSTPNTHIHDSTRSWFLVLHPLHQTYIYTTAHVPGFWYFILYTQHTYTRQHTFLVSGTSSSTPNTHIHDSTRSLFLVLHPLHPTHIYTTAHVPGFWYFILYSQHTYTRQHTFLVSDTSSSTPNTHIHDSTRSLFLILHPLLPTHIYTTAHVPCFWYFILYTQHTYTRQHTFLVSDTSSSTPNTHIHDSTRSWFLILHPLLPTHIYTTAHVPCFWYFILYSQHTYTRQHTFLVSDTSSSTPNTHIHDSTRSWFLILHPLLPTHIYTTAHVPCFWYFTLYSQHTYTRQHTFLVSGTSSSKPNTHIHDSTRSWFLILHPLHPTHIYTIAHVPGFWYFILYSQHTYTRQHTFLVSGTSSSTPNTHIHDSTRSLFLVLHPLHPTHIYTIAHVPGFWYFILYTQHTYTRQHTFLDSDTSPSTPNTHIHDSTRSWFLVLHPLLPTHIYTTAHVPGFWYFILYTQHTYTRQHTFLVSGTSSSTPNTHIHDSTRSWFLVLHPLHPTHIYTTAHVPGFWYFILYSQHTYTRQHTFLDSDTSPSTPNTHIHDSTRFWFLILHPLLPTHIYTTAHVPGFWYFILYTQHTYTRQHTFLGSGTSSSTPNTHIHDSTRSWFLVLHPLHPTHIYTTAHVPGFWYFILYSQHTYTRQHTFLVSGTSPSTPNTHIHDSTRSWFLVLHPLHPTHIYTTAHVPGFWYFILYTQHTYTRQHTFLVSGTSSSTPNTHIHDSTRSWFLVLHPLLPTHIYTTAHVPGFWYFILYSQHTYTRQHTFLVSGTSSSTPNTHIHDSTRFWFLVLHPLLPTHI